MSDLMEQDVAPFGVQAEGLEFPYVYFDASSVTDPYVIAFDLKRHDYRVSWVVASPHPVDPSGIDRVLRLNAEPSGQTGAADQLAQIVFREPSFREPLLAIHPKPCAHPFSSCDLPELPDAVVAGWWKDGLSSDRSVLSIPAKVVAMCMEAGFSPSITHEVNTFSSVLGIVAAGLGVSIVPAICVLLAHPGIVLRRLTPSRHRSVLALLTPGDRHHPMREVVERLGRTRWLQMRRKA